MNKRMVLLLGLLGTVSIVQLQCMMSAQYEIQDEMQTLEGSKNLAEQAYEYPRPLQCMTRQELLDAQYEIQDKMQTLEGSRNRADRKARRILFKQLGDVKTFLAAWSKNSYMKAMRSPECVMRKRKIDKRYVKPFNY